MVVAIGLLGTPSEVSTVEWVYVTGEPPFIETQTLTALWVPPARWVGHTSSAPEVLVVATLVTALHVDVLGVNDAS